MKKDKMTMGYVLNKDQQRLAEENWDFAAGVARRYAGGCVPMADLESEAWTALCYAAFKYKKVEGCKFTSYAYYFIVWASDFPNVKRGGGTPVWTKGEGVFPAKALERIFDETNIKELRQGRLYSNVPDGYRIVDRLFITLQ